MAYHHDEIDVVSLLLEDKLKPQFLDKLMDWLAS